MTAGRVAAVVGGLGLIGSAITSVLRADGWEVVVVEPDRDRDGVRYGDLLVPESLPAAVAGSSVVIQCANFPTFPIERPKLRHTFEDFDVRGTAALVAAAERMGCRRYLYFSGSGADGANPCFQAMKRGERAVLDSGLEGVCLRPTLVYGPGDRTLNQIVALGRRSRLIPLLGNGRQQYQPVYVDDVAELARQAAEPGGPQGVFEIGGPERLSFDELIATALEVAGVGRRRLLHIPLGLARAAAMVLRRVPAVDFAARDDIADLTAVRGSFDVRLTPLRDGLGRYLGGEVPVR